MPGWETLPEKGEATIAVKSSIFFNKSYQGSWDEIILTKKNCLYTKTCCVRSFYKKMWVYWILCLIQTLRPQKIKK